MTTKTITRETEKATIKMTLHRAVLSSTDDWGHVYNQEHYECWELTLTLKSNGKSVHGEGYKRSPFDPAGINAPAGAVARIGQNGYVSQAIYDICQDMMSELDAALPKTDEYLALEAEAVRKAKRAEENLDRMEAERSERESHPGWCSKCQSYCYGDCQS